MATATVATPEEFLRARLNLLNKEKELTRALDALAEERRALPMVEVTTDYIFTAPDDSSSDPKATKKVTLKDLFDGRRQLIIYHFMYGPDQLEGKECSGCSVMADHFPPLEHLHGRDTSFVVVSRAPPHKFSPYKEKMGWKFPWVSSEGSRFNFDFKVSEEKSDSVSDQPGASCFVLGGGEAGGEEGKIYHTYSNGARGLENKAPTFAWLDLTKLGRQTKAMFPLRYEYTPEMLKGSA